MLIALLTAPELCASADLTTKGILLYSVTSTRVSRIHVGSMQIVLLQDSGLFVNVGVVMSEIPFPSAAWSPVPPVLVVLMLTAPPTVGQLSVSVSLITPGTLTPTVDLIRAKPLPVASKQFARTMAELRYVSVLHSISEIHMCLVDLIPVYRTPVDQMLIALEVGNVLFVDVDQGTWEVLTAGLAVVLILASRESVALGQSVRMWVDVLCVSVCKVIGGILTQAVSGVNVTKMLTAVLSVLAKIISVWIPVLYPAGRVLTATSKTMSLSVGVLVALPGIHS